MRPVYTSGPFAAKNHTIYSPSGIELATVHTTEHDAQLLAAASEMRALLIQAGRHFDEMPKRGERARSLHLAIKSLINKLEKSGK
jgi:hypothetical protein